MAFAIADEQTEMLAVCFLVDEDSLSRSPDGLRVRLNLAPKLHDVTNRYNSSIIRTVH